jgi:hypothetical protein
MTHKAQEERDSLGAERLGEREGAGLRPVPDRSGSEAPNTSVPSGWEREARAAVDRR